MDNVTLENYWDARASRIYPTGQIELQNHGSVLWFRNVYLREILAEPQNDKGFVGLFNGKDMAGWVGPPTSTRSRTVT